MGFPCFISPCRTLRFVGGMVGGSPISLVSDPSNEGPSRALKETVVRSALLIL